MEMQNYKLQKSDYNLHKDEDDPIAYYLKQINKIPLLRPEEEKKCISK